MVARKSIPSVKVPNRDVAPATSRYKKVRYFQRSHPGIGSFIEPETWNPPEILRRDDDKFTEVKAGEEGRLDLVALRLYKTDRLWWVIALANNILDPFTDVPVGRTLRYPSFEYLTASVLA